MSKVKAVVAILMVLAAFASVRQPVRHADIGGLFGSYWGGWAAAAGAIVGGIGGGLAGSAIAPGPGTVLGEMSGSDIGMLVGGA